MYLSYRIQERHKCWAKIPKSCKFWNLVHFQRVLTRKKNMLYQIYKSISSHLTWALFSPCCAKREVASQLEAWDASFDNQSGGGCNDAFIKLSSFHIGWKGESIASFNDVNDQFQLQLVFLWSTPVPRDRWAWKTLWLLRHGFSISRVKSSEQGLSVMPDWWRKHPGKYHLIGLNLSTSPWVLLGRFGGWILYRLEIMLYFARCILMLIH